MTDRPITGEPISPRHLRALALIAAGHTNADIGHTLGVTTHTANWYVKQLLARLGAHDRAHAVALAIRHGYLPLDEIRPHPQLPTLDEPAADDWPDGDPRRYMRRRRRWMPIDDLDDIDNYQPAA